MAVNNANNSNNDGQDNSDAYSQEGQFTEGLVANNNNNNNDNNINDPNDVLPSYDQVWGQTKGGPTPMGPDNDDDDIIESSDDDDDDDNDNNNNNRNSVDLCILCDVTTSMDLWILEVKNEIRHIINDLKNTFGIGKLRVSFLGYRDWNDNNNNSGHKRIEKLDFTTKINKFEKFVANIKAVGGGDAAEDVLGGIQQTINLKWESQIRLIYHICDAPAHGIVYHNLYDLLVVQKKQHKKVTSKFTLFLGDLSDVDSSDTDSYINDDDDGKSDELIIMTNDNDKDNGNGNDNDIENKLLRDEMDKWPNKHPNDPNHQDLFIALQQKNIQYHIGKQGPHCDKMIQVFQTYCKSINYNFKVLDLVNVRQFFPTLIEAVSDAIRICRPPQKKRPINLPSLPQLRKKKRASFKVYCGIDFGTAGSGFAYALPGKNEVFTDQAWSGGKHIDVKTKTNILLDKTGKCIAFGDAATDKYIRMGQDDDSDDDDDKANDNNKKYLFFERFKMALYDKPLHNDDDDKKNNDKDDKKVVDIKNYISATNGLKIESRKVLEEAIKFMKNHALGILQKKLKNTNLKTTDIQWILTVPAIWSDKAKSIMRTAAINAGMIDPDIDNQLIIAYEPDCASLSIQSELKDQLLKMKEQQKLQNPDIVDDDDDDDGGFFDCGDRILLCDLGGGTADIACHEIDANDCIKEIAAPSGGPWGSTYVDQNFENLLNDIFTKNWMNEFITESSSAYIELLNNFRSAKKKFYFDAKKKVKKKDYHTTSHNVQIPFLFREFMEEKIEEKINNIKKKLHNFDDDDTDDDDDDFNDDEALEKLVYNFRIKDLKKKSKNLRGLIRITDEYFEISYTVWHYLFDSVINCIISHCKYLLSLPAMKDDGCKYLILVGGFSESRYLKMKFFRAFGKKSSYGLMIITPKRPILSVVDGAARMGLKPDFISARTISATYGIAIQKDLSEFKKIYPNALIPKSKVSMRLVYSQNKQMISKQVINDVFFPFIRKNTLIKIDDPPIIYYVEPADIKTDFINIKLYNSDHIDPIFVDGNIISNIQIKLPNKYQKYQIKEPIPIIFVFCDTTIRVFVDIDTGNNNDNQAAAKEISINFDVKK